MWGLCVAQIIAEKNVSTIEQFERGNKGKISKTLSIVQTRGNNFDNRQQVTATSVAVISSNKR